ncbi:MAG TPA: hypothetical protein VGX92_17650 [Pyrinomonadaceae bacterium]|nr:hypothetical protein [Pyrinomonadaceae bacterium]
MNILAPLAEDDLRSRLKFDYQVVMQMRSPLMNVAAYRNVDDLRARRNPIATDTEGHLATHYLIDYHIKTLVGRGRYSERTTVHADLLASNNYPFLDPACYVIDSELPWSPHFLQHRPICLGELWEQSEGAMLFGELLVHIAKLLNFDEVARGGGYVGWNGEAVEYWKSELKEQPITKNLRYPALPDSVLPVPEPQETTKAFVRRKVTGMVGDAATSPFQARKTGAVKAVSPAFKVRNTTRTPE